MKVFNRVEEVNFKNPIVVLGNFDGCHLAHQELIKNSLRLREEMGREVLIITFDPHPRTARGEALLKLQTLGEKLETLESLGVDGVLVVPFTQAFLKMNYVDFVKDILVDAVAASAVVVGYNYRFGYEGQGDVNYLEEMSASNGFKLVVVPAFKVNDFPVNSSYIRQMVKEGNIGKVNLLLGSRFSMEGEVVHGAGEGRKVLGYPTANLQVDEEKIIPKVGVYIALVEVEGKWYRGILNVGYQPTFNRKKLAVEVHILDFDKMIYGENIKVAFLEYLRGEKKFTSKEELIAQLAEDAEKGKRLAMDE